jgi:hypothetical protein
LANIHESPRFDVTRRRTGTVTGFCAALLNSDVDNGLEPVWLPTKNEKARAGRAFKIDKEWWAV